MQINSYSQYKICQYNYVQYNSINSLMTKYLISIVM